VTSFERREAIRDAELCIPETFKLRLNRPWSSAPPRKREDDWGRFAGCLTHAGYSVFLADRSCHQVCLHVQASRPHVRLVLLGSRSAGEGGVAQGRRKHPPAAASEYRSIHGYTPYIGTHPGLVAANLARKKVIDERIFSRPNLS